MWAVGEQSELETPSGEQSDPPWTDLGALLESMLAQCWAHAGPMLEAVGVLGAFQPFLERSGGDLERKVDQHRAEDEKKRLDVRKFMKKHMFLNAF